MVRDDRHTQDTQQTGHDGLKDKTMEAHDFYYDIKKAREEINTSLSGTVTILDSILKTLERAPRSGGYSKCSNCHHEEGEEGVMCSVLKASGAKPEEFYCTQIAFRYLD